MKRLIVLLVACAATLLMVACGTADYTAYALAAAEEAGRGGNLPPAHLPPDEKNIVDFTIYQSIGNDMPTFAFRVTGEIDDDDAVRIHAITITDEDGALLQKIDNLQTWLPLTSPFGPFIGEKNNWGFALADYNFDGYLDISLFRWPGGSARNHERYFWLWDAETGQFVKNEQLMALSRSGFVQADDRHQQLRLYRPGDGQTDLGHVTYFDYADGELVVAAMIERISHEGRTYVHLHVPKPTHPDLPEFQIIAFGRKVPAEGIPYGYFVEFTAIRVWYFRYLAQRIDGLSTQLLDISLRRPDGRFVLHFDDFNFDGYMDMSLMKFTPNGACNHENHYYWLWDPTLSTFGQFVITDMINNDFD